MRITVCGPGCMKCHEAEELVKMGIISTPGFAVDGVLKLAGRVPKADEIKGWLGK